MRWRRVEGEETSEKKIKITLKFLFIRQQQQQTTKPMNKLTNQPSKQPPPRSQNLKIFKTKRNEKELG